MEKIRKMLDEGVRVINVGLVDFAEALMDQEAEVVHVDWRPPAGGNEDLQKILNALLR